MPLAIDGVLVCTKCKSELFFKNDQLTCINDNCNSTYSKSGSIYNFLGKSEDQDLNLSINKWDDFYAKTENASTYEKKYQIYMEDNYENVYSQIAEYHPLTSGTVFLEIGCGPMFLARAISNKCKLVVGIDFSISALRVAQKMLKEHNIKNYLLILGDIKKMPIKENSVDILYGGGVIEHFEDTSTALEELYRVLKPGGVSFNTVPHLNIGSLTYRQVWGNIPNFPILKQLAELIHIKLLGAKHMIFGYELSFLGTHLKHLHKKAGFKKVYVRKFETKLMFEFIPIARVRNFLDWLANNSPLFWPMIKVIGIK